MINTGGVSGKNGGRGGGVFASASAVALVDSAPMTAPASYANFVLAERRREDQQQAACETFEHNSISYLTPPFLPIFHTLHNIRVYEKQINFPCISWIFTWYGQNAVVFNISLCLLVFL